jgi:hypothetical protein
MCTQGQWEWYKFEKKPTGQKGHIRDFFLICEMCLRFSTVGRADNCFSDFVVARKIHASLHLRQVKQNSKLFSVNVTFMATSDELVSAVKLTLCARTEVNYYRRQFQV